ncbi:MAG TPA: hypothetical protein VE172_04960 [Stackebrandtia sp.]|uniref:hypothetical protein n=1 Tax=Stackebrandtia sp. TaxID=2023065 RepID=UPI002D4C92C8|nr:hypothetical protein [Stackebrandtia sp.]HZE38144.1 hypothetical protein [Stackebrandtia sp.]
MGTLFDYARRGLATGTGAFGARAVSAAIDRSRLAPRLSRSNYRGGTVSLKAGPAAAVAGSVAAAVGTRTPAHAAAALTAGLGSGAVGLYDDLVDATAPVTEPKGLRGHLGALMSGRVTGGAVKAVGIGLSGLAAAILIDSARPAKRPRSKASRAVNIALGAGVIAGTANLVNLFDLRAGRALKVVSAVSGPLSARSDSAGGIAAGTLGAAGALLPEDLAEETMLGDCGANALGALVGLSLAARSAPVTRAAILAVVAALTVASEKISFTQVIAETPVLRTIDEYGARPRQ